MSNVHASFPVLVNGCAGKMGQAVAGASVSAGLNPLPFSFGGPDVAGQIINIGDTGVQILEPSEGESTLSSVFSKNPDMVVVDFTVPDAVNGKQPAVQ